MIEKPVKRNGICLYATMYLKLKKKKNTITKTRE